MYRRQFLLRGLSAAGACILPSLALSRDRPSDLLINDAYALWYNSPHVAPIRSGFCLGSLTSAGDLSIAQISNDLVLISKTTIFGFAGASDHGSPALIRISVGPHSGKLLACFSNHASELFCVRSAFPDSAIRWGAVRSVDEGRCTYASLAALPDGRILLIHTLQDNAGKYSDGEWRKTVARISQDGGDNWSAPCTVAAFGAGTFPYSAPISVSPAGRCALVYSLYSSNTKLHNGLTLALSDHAFEQIDEIPIVTGNSSLSNIVPYQARWRGRNELFVTYSASDGATQAVMGKMVHIVFDQTGLIKQMDTITIGETARGTYPTGACLTPDCSAVVYCPADGGILLQRVDGGYRRRIITSGRFSSPYIFESGDTALLSVLDNPLIESSRNFRANIRILRLA